DQAGAQARGGHGVALRTTRSPGASPLTTSTRPLASSAPSVTARTTVRPFSHTSTYPASAIAARGIATMRRRSAPSRTATLAPGRKSEPAAGSDFRSEEHTSELQSRGHLVCRLLLEKKKRRQRCTSR